jgi:flagellar basal body-associated protein FliL
MPNAEKTDRDEQQADQRRLPMRMMIVVASIMLLEGAGVFLFVTMTGARPASAVAGVEGADEADREATVEILLCKDRYQNMSTNRLWRWDAVVYMKVRKKNEAFVNETMEHRAAEIQAGLSQIFRSAQHSHLKEPELKTITRQLTAYVNEVFGEDPDGMPRVDRVLITTLNGLPTDG